MLYDNTINHLESTENHSYITKVKNRDEPFWKDNMTIEEFCWGLPEILAKVQERCKKIMDIGRRGFQIWTVVTGSKES